MPMVLSNQERKTVAAENRAFEHASGPRPSMRERINLQCKDCIYDSESGGGSWRQQVEACDDRTCPLWALRPRSKANLADEGAETPRSWPTDERGCGGAGPSSLGAAEDGKIA